MQVLNDQTFAIMVLVAIFTTFIMTPVVMETYKLTKNMGKALYKDRSIEKQDSKIELQILACFHRIRNIP